MKRTTLEAICRAYNTVSDDPTRYHLNYVAINGAIGGLVRIRSTNGHCLNECLLEDSELSEILDGKTVLIHHDQLPQIKLLLRDKNCQDFLITPGESHSFTIGTTLNKVLAESSKTDYPNTDALWLKYQVEPMQIRINPELLMDLYKAMNSEKRDTGVTLVIRDKLSPIIVTHGNAKGLLMPMRFDAKEYCPAKTESEAS